MTKHITKTYQMGEEVVKALDNVSIEIEKGDFVSVMGASGSGKSTLMNLLGCLDTPTSGDYFLNGVNVATMNDDKLAAIRNKEIGFVFQTFNLLPNQTALYNVEVPLIYSGINKKIRKQLCEEILTKVGMKDRMHHKPNELSGGQRQRVAIARALANKPSIILADEPTGNLDSKTTNDIMELFQQLHNDGNTIILVTHEKDIGSLAKRTIVLKDGKIIKDVNNVF
jgi:putative ABC transport system ATP-binding protein